MKNGAESDKYPSG